MTRIANYMPDLNYDGPSAGVEICQFQLKNNCSEDALLVLMEKIKTDFLLPQPGFMKHQTIPLENGEFIDICISENLPCATAISSKRLDHPLTLALLDMMEPSSITLSFCNHEPL